MSIEKKEKCRETTLFWVRATAHTLTLFTETFVIYYVSGNLYQIIMAVDGESVLYHADEAQNISNQSGLIFWLLFTGRGLGCLLTGMIRDKIRTSVPIMPILQLLLGATTVAIAFVGNSIL